MLEIEWEHIPEVLLRFYIVMKNNNAAWLRKSDGYGKAFLFRKAFIIIPAQYTPHDDLIVWLQMSDLPSADLSVGWPEQFPLLIVPVV